MTNYRAIQTWSMVEAQAVADWVNRFQPEYTVKTLGSLVILKGDQEDTDSKVFNHILSTAKGIEYHVTHLNELFEEEDNAN